MSRKEELQNLISIYTSKLENCQNELAALLLEEENTAKLIAKAEKTTLLENTLNSLFDGVKFSNTQDTAIEVSYPMMYCANLYYKVVENDGIKNIDKIYVCMPPQGTPMQGELTAENFNTLMVEM